MTYRYVFSAILCDRFTSNFMKACGTTIEHVGIRTDYIF